MDQKCAQELLAKAGAFNSGHFVFTSGRHSDTYINKDAVYPHTRITDEVCKSLALAFDRENIEIVAAPEKGAIVLGQGVAQWLERYRTLSERPEVLSVYADKEGQGFIFKRGYELLIPGKRVLIVEDLLTTGGSAKNTATAVRKLGGQVIGVAAMVNRGGVRAEHMGVPRLVSLLEVDGRTFDPKQCPLCRDGVPVHTGLGHGKKFVAEALSPA